MKIWFPTLKINNPFIAAHRCRLVWSQWLIKDVYDIWMKVINKRVTSVSICWFQYQTGKYYYCWGLLAFVCPSRSVEVFICHWRTFFTCVTYNSFWFLKLWLPTPVLWVKMTEQHVHCNILTAFLVCMLKPECDLLSCCRSTGSKLKGKGLKSHLIPPHIKKWEGDIFKVCKCLYR